MKIIIVHFLEGKMKNIEIEKDNFSKLMVALWSSNTYSLSGFRNNTRLNLPCLRNGGFHFANAGSRIFSYYPGMTCHKRDSSFKIGRNVLVCKYVHSYCRWAIWVASVKSKFCLAKIETEQRDLGDL